MLDPVGAGTAHLDKIPVSSSWHKASRPSIGMMVDYFLLEYRSHAETLGNNPTALSDPLSRKVQHSRKYRAMQVHVISKDRY